MDAVTLPYPFSGNHTLLYPCLLLDSAAILGPVMADLLKFSRLQALGSAFRRWPEVRCPSRLGERLC
jgi:hypothetical protein